MKVSPTSGLSLQAQTIRPGTPIGRLSGEGLEKEQSRQLRPTRLSPEPHSDTGCPETLRAGKEEILWNLPAPRCPVDLPPLPAGTLLLQV